VLHILPKRSFALHTSSYGSVPILQGRCCEEPPLFPVTTLTGYRASLDIPLLVPHGPFFALRYPACWASATLANVTTHTISRLWLTDHIELIPYSLQLYTMLYLSQIILSLPLVCFRQACVTHAFSSHRHRKPALIVVQKAYSTHQAFRHRDTIKTSGWVSAIVEDHPYHHHNFSL
jgi:hypothetical protein